MSVHNPDIKRVTTHTLQELKSKGVEFIKPPAMIKIDVLALPGNSYKTETKSEQTCTDQGWKRLNSITQKILISHRVYFDSE